MKFFAGLLHQRGGPGDGGAAGGRLPLLQPHTLRPGNSTISLTLLFLEGGGHFGLRNDKCLKLQFKLRKFGEKKVAMVLILDGSSEHGAHIWNTSGI